VGSTNNWHDLQLIYPGKEPHHGHPLSHPSQKTRRMGNPEVGG
jgi:hypothetical protein